MRCTEVASSLKRYAAMPALLVVWFPTMKKVSVVFLAVLRNLVAIALGSCSAWLATMFVHGRKALLSAYPWIDGACVAAVIVGVVVVLQWLLGTAIRWPVLYPLVVRVTLILYFAFQLLLVG